MKIKSSLFGTKSWIENSLGEIVTEKVNDKLEILPIDCFYLVSSYSMTNTWLFNKKTEKLVFKSSEDFHIETVNENMYLIAFCFNEDNMFVIDADGNILLENVLVNRYQVLFFDRIPARQKGKWGYIDSNAKWVVAPQYDYVRPFNKFGYAICSKNGNTVVIDTDGNPLTTLKKYTATELSTGEILIKTKDKLCGLIDKTGREILPPIYEEISAIPNTRYLEIRTSTGVGVADKKGRIVLTPKFDNVNVKGDRIHAQRTVSVELELK